MKRLALCLVLAFGICIGFAQNVTSVRLQEDCLVGGTSTTGTVIIDVQSASPTVIYLVSDNPSLQVPSQVVVPAGWPLPRANFTATTSAVGEIVTGRITARCGDRSQVSDFTVVPSESSLNVQYLSATAGRGIVCLSWKKLEDGSFEQSLKGYKIRRKDPIGEVVDLVGTATVTNGFLDTSATAGTAYSYQVYLVSPTGVTKGVSSWVSATPLAGATLNWVVSPPAPPAICSGFIGFSASTQLGGGAQPPSPAGGKVASAAPLPSSIGGPPASGTVYLNGSRIGEAHPPTPESGQSQYVLFGGIDTAALDTVPNQLHIVAELNGVPVATPVACENPVTGVSVEDVLDKVVGELSVLRFTYGGTYVSPGPAWTISVKSGPNVVRSWSGIGASPEVAWDGRNATGEPVPEGDYDVSISFENGQAVSTPKPVTVVNGNPTFLALISVMETTNPSSTITFAANLRQYMEQRRMLYPNLKPLILVRYHILDFGPNQTPLVVASEKLRLRIRKWLQNSVEDFYYYGHGGFDTSTTPYSGFFRWGGLSFWSANQYQKSGELADLVHPEQKLSVYALASSRWPFNSVFLDCCFGWGTAANPSQHWLTAWCITDDLEQCFLGWRGYSYKNSMNSGALTAWYSWRNIYWQRICQGYYVSQAITLAHLLASGANPGELPWDPGKTQLFGNAQIPKY
jgi:hypothetical protein